jgi:hypothetical protein
MKLQSSPNIIILIQQLQSADIIPLLEETSLMNDEELEVEGLMLGRGKWGEMGVG